MLRGKYGWGLSNNNKLQSWRRMEVANFGKLAVQVVITAFKQLTLCKRYPSKCIAQDWSRRLWQAQTCCRWKAEKCSCRICTQSRTWKTDGRGSCMASWLFNKHRRMASFADANWTSTTYWSTTTLSPATDVCQWFSCWYRQCSVSSVFETCDVRATHWHWSGNQELRNRSCWASYWTQSCHCSLPEPYRSSTK